MTLAKTTVTLTDGITVSSNSYLDRTIEIFETCGFEITGKIEEAIKNIVVYHIHQQIQLCEVVKGKLDETFSWSVLQYPFKKDFAANILLQIQQSGIPIHFLSIGSQIANRLNEERERTLRMICGQIMSKTDTVEKLDQLISDLTELKVSVRKL